jgi:hypothetical protein
MAKTDNTCRQTKRNQKKPEVAPEENRRRWLKQPKPREKGNGSKMRPDADFKTQITVAAKWNLRSNISTGNGNSSNHKRMNISMVKSSPDCRASDNS